MSWPPEVAEELKGCAVGRTHAVGRASQRRRPNNSCVCTESRLKQEDLITGRLGTAHDS